MLPSNGRNARIALPNFLSAKPSICFCLLILNGRQSAPDKIFSGWASNGRSYLEKASPITGQAGYPSPHLSLERSTSK